MTSLSAVPSGKIPDATAMPVPHVLRYSSPPDNFGHVDYHYFVSHGERITTARTTLTLIERTSTQKGQATVFPSEAHAIAAWDLSGRPDSWEAVRA